MDGGSITFYKNGVSQGAKTRTVAGRVPLVYGDGTGAWTANFGQRPFAYPVSGFKALNTSSLPAPVVTKPSTVMDVKLWTGNDTARSITGYGFSPDLVWIKDRSNARENVLFDTVRGATKVIYSNATSSEQTYSDGLTAFNSDGFSLGSDQTYAYVNYGSETYVGWAWDAGSSTVTNTQGSISSQVRANASAGFSIVTYTGTGSNATVGHGLGVAPSFVIVKRRSNADDWLVYVSALGNSYLRLQSTDASTSASAAVWNNTAPSSSVFSVGTSSGVNASSSTYVAYCFAPVAGYSSFGSFSANNSSDGNFIYLGFRPRWIMTKQTSGGGGNWFILDTARNTYNVMNNILDANLSDAERNANIWDATANGMKLRIALSGDFIYAAFAEHPFQYARAR
jgi:hypothetical protein